MRSSPSAATGTGSKGNGDIALSAASPAATITIVDNEKPQATLVLTPAKISEKGGVSLVTAMLNKPAAAPTSIIVSTTGVGPTAASDFRLSADKMLTIPAGKTESAGGVSITAEDNSTFAADKVVRVSGEVNPASGVVAPAAVILTIVEDDYSCANTTATPSTASAGLVADCETLLACQTILRGTDVAFLNTLQWSVDRAIGSWNGVTVENGRVTRLSLPFKLLKGNIPANLGDLSSLTHLDLSSNNLGDGIPATLGKLPGLTRLNLSSNRLRGGIPATLGKLSSLTHLDLSSNRLTGEIPAELAGLSRVTSLNLIRNNLRGEVTLAASPGRVTEISGARAITVTATLDAGVAWANKYADAGSSVAVSVSGSGSRQDVVDFTPVENFTITVPKGQSAATVRFTLIPTADTVLEKDETVILSAAGTGARGVADLRLRATAPKATITLTDGDPQAWLALTPDYISENGGVSRVTAFLDNPSGADTVVTVSAAPVSPATASDFTLSDNKTLTIPAGETQSSGLVTLSAQDDSVSSANKTVTISGAVNNLKVLPPSSVTLTIAEDDYDCKGSTAVPDNTVTISMPRLLSDCEYLLAARDVLRGDATLNWSRDLYIGSWEGVGFAWGQVVELMLRNKGLTGSIPAQLGRLETLHFLYLSGNRLKGHIPKELSRVPARDLVLRDNELSGGIPPELGRMRTLAILDLSDNRLTARFRRSWWSEALAEKRPVCVA